MKENHGVIWTIGHSTRTIEQFLELIDEHKVKLLADVRQFPGSRRYPQFGKAQLAAELERAGIIYTHLPELGGRRRARPDSQNTAWRNEAFRGYADYMETAQFKAGIDRLLEAGSSSVTAMMCAEALWWRCHRALISDYLKAMGYTVKHIIGPHKVEEHPFTTAAHIVDSKLSYSAQQPH